MKTKTGLLALGLFTIAGAFTVSCGGSSDSDDNTPTAGTSSGGSGSGGKSSSAGTTNNRAGTANDGGTATNNGGTTNSGGRNNNGGRNNTGGFNPGGGAPNLPDCPDSAGSGKPCTPDGNNNACQLDDTSFCICSGQQNPTWSCPNLGDFGAGGDGGGLGGAVTCPADGKNGDVCTGTGVCPGSQTCGCLFGSLICQ